MNNGEEAFPSIGSNANANASTGRDEEATEPEEATGEAAAAGDETAAGEEEGAGESVQNQLDQAANAGTAMEASAAAGAATGREASTSDGSTGKQAADVGLVVVDNSVAKEVTSMLRVFLAKDTRDKCISRLDALLGDISLDISYGESDQENKDLVQAMVETMRVFRDLCERVVSESYQTHGSRHTLRE